MSAAPQCLYSARRIAARVRELGEAVRARFPDETLTVLGILKGSVVFTSDLVRVIGEPAELSFVHARSYGKGTRSTGEVRLSAFEEDVLRDRVVIVTDTILDTGLTLRTVTDAVRAVGARDVVTCVLLDKPARRRVDIQPDLIGFEVPDDFLVGYGLDHAGRYRALPYVGVLHAGTDGH